MVKTLVYQSMDPGLNPGVGKNFFFQKNAKISRCIYASLACKGLIVNTLFQFHQLLVHISQVDKSMHVYTRLIIN